MSLEEALAEIDRLQAELAGARGALERWKASAESIKAFDEALERLTMKGNGAFRSALQPS